MSTSNDELKSLIKGIPAATRDTMREEMQGIADAAAEKAITGHVKACAADRQAAEEERSKVIQIRKKSALWWVKMAGAITILLASGAGIKPVVEFLKSAF